MIAPKTKKGQHRQVEVAITAWIDLLGYGSMLEKGSFEPFNTETLNALKRITLFHDEVAKKSSKIFPSMVMNDGAIVFRDLSPRSRELTFDFIYRAFKLYSHINGVERKNGYPGARMVIATGFRIRKHSQIKQHLIDGIGSFILGKLDKSEMSKEQAIIHSLMTRANFDIFPELQANFAFAKAYIADAGGSKKGIAGPYCYLDTTILEDELPEWIRFSGFVDWEDRGLRAKFGVIDGIIKTLAKEQKFKGALDAFEVASRISSDPDIVSKLKSQTYSLKNRINY